MSIQKLERVMWRVRKRNPGNDTPTWTEFKRAIMYECGTSKATYKANISALKSLGWIKTRKGKRTKLTNTDLTGD